MRNLLIAIIFAIMSVTSANAGITTNDLDFSGLTEAQKATLIQKAEEMKTPNIGNLEQLSQYAEFGRAFGSALNETAKELGSTANEFIYTPVGQIATVLIIWKVAGDSILGFVVGSIWFLIMLPVWIIYFNKMVIKPSWKTVAVTENGRTTTTSIKHIPVSTDEWNGVILTKVVFCGSLILLVTIGLIIML